MKARLVKRNESLELLLCTGDVQYVSNAEANRFLLNCDDPAYYEGEGKWDDDIVPMGSYHGDTIAVVLDSGILQIEDQEAFRTIMSMQDQLLTVPQYAELHGKKTGIIRRFCLEGRIQGAIQRGTRWLIPESSPYPTSEK